MTGHLKRLESFEYLPEPDSADVVIHQERLANASTSFTLFNRFPPEIRQMVWRKAAEEEMKTRVVPLMEGDWAVSKFLLLPIPALSSSLLKTCYDGRAASLPLLLLAFDIFGSRKHQCCFDEEMKDEEMKDMEDIDDALEGICKGCYICCECCCDCDRPSGILYINPAVDVCVYFQASEDHPWNIMEWLPPSEGHRLLKLPGNTRHSFRRLITASWHMSEDYES